MSLVVVDPRLLVKAFIYPRGRFARLLGLCIYGLVSLDAEGHSAAEADAADDQFGHVADDAELAAVRDWADHVQREAVVRKALLEKALEQHVPKLLLVMSPILREELLELAQQAQLRYPWVRPDMVKRHIARWGAVSLTDVDSTPFELSAGRPAARGFLVRTAFDGEADFLITDDEELEAIGDLRHSDARTRRTVRAYSFNDFVADQLYNIDFDAIDAAAVWAAAYEQLGALSG